MKINQLTYQFTSVFLLSIVLLFTSCIKDPDSPGYEYSDDMARSQAIEAYVDYGLVGDKRSTSLQSTKSARKPPSGSIAYFEDSRKAKVYMPFDYGPSDSERLRAGKEYTTPEQFINNKQAIKEGKRLYGIFCSHCHGDDGKGNGPVYKVSKEIIACPDLTDVTTEIQSQGAIFHVITHGKGIMGPHASQLNKEERWMLVQYIRTELKGYDDSTEKQDSTIQENIEQQEIMANTNNN